MPEKKMIDWEAYRKGLRELEKSETQPDVANHQPRLPPPDNQTDPGTELLRQQARNAGQTARSLAAGNVGLHLGDLLGAGDAPVADFNEKPVLDAFGKHDQLLRLLGNRLTQNYRQIKCPCFLRKALSLVGEGGYRKLQQTFPPPKHLPQKFICFVYICGKPN